MVDEGDEREEKLPEEDPEKILEVYLGLRERPVKPEPAGAEGSAARPQRVAGALCAGHLAGLGRGGYRGRDRDRRGARGQGNRY